MVRKDQKEIKFVERQDPEHPYCTNWPMSEKEEKIEFKVGAIVPKVLVGWLGIELPKSVMTRLQSYIETAKKNPTNWNYDLAGNISKSLIIIDKDNWFIETVLIPLISKFAECYPSYAKGLNFLTENAPYCLNQFWVNFQKQHEFNPLHDHSGAFSFVIFVKIPTNWKEQHALPISANSNSPRASDFEFQFTSILGDITHFSYYLDKTSEGFMLLFPAKLKHTVYPFYNCDKERISISGNICYDISENAMSQLRSQMNRDKENALKKIESIKGKDGKKSS